MISSSWKLQTCSCNRPLKSIILCELYSQTWIMKMQFYSSPKMKSFFLFLGTTFVFFSQFWPLLCANKEKYKDFFGSVGMDGQRHLQASQLFAVAAQDSLDPVVPVGQPVRQIHVGQVEVGLRQRVRALQGQKIHRVR